MKQIESAPTPVGTYAYDARRYLFDVEIPAVIGAVVIPIAAYFAWAGIGVPIAIGVMILGAYVAGNTFVARTYPRTVALDEATLSLTSFGRTDTYRLDELTRLQVRENGMTRNAYVRVNGGGLLRGRYFIGCGDMYDESGERALGLYQFLLDTEARLDPDNLRVRARVAEGRGGRAPKRASRR